MSGCHQTLAAGKKPSSQDIVLVHGAWHGGWCWEKLEPLLADAGYRVHALTLSGLGNRAAELNGDIGLDAHIDDVENYVVDRGLEGFVLVGHSYGGMVITGATDRLRDRIRHVVYLDAALPKSGESMISYGEPRSAEVVAAAESSLRALAPDGVRIPPFPVEIFGIPRSHPFHDWANERLTPHPLKTWLDPITLDRRGSEGLPRTYIHCVDPVLPQTQFPYIAKQVSADPTWRYFELQTGHDAMITDPEGLASILAELHSFQRESDR